MPIQPTVSGHRARSWRRWLAIAPFGILLGVTAADAATEYHWKSATNGRWNDAAMWTPAGFPGSGRVQGDSAVIDAVGAGEYTVDYPILASFEESNTFDRLVVDSSDATLRITGSIRIGATVNEILLESGEIELAGRLSLTAGNITLNDGRFTVNDNVRIDAVALANRTEFAVPANGLDFRVRTQFDRVVPTFTHSAGGTLHLDGPLHFRGFRSSAFVNDGGAITGEGSVHLYDGVLLQRRAPSSPGGTFVSRGEVRLVGVDPSVNQVFPGQTLVLRNDATEYVRFPMVEAYDGFRNNGTIVLESVGATPGVYLAVRMPPEPYSEPGSMVNAGHFVVRRDLSGVGAPRGVIGTFVNAPDGTVTLDGPMRFLTGLVNSGTLTITPADTLHIGPSDTPAPARLVQKAGLLNVPGTIDMNYEGTFVNEGGVIAGNPRVRFPYGGTLVNDIAADNGKATFEFADRFARIGTSASGKVLIGAGQTVVDGPDLRHLTGDLGFTNAGTLKLSHFTVVRAAGNGPGTTDGWVTNEGTVHFMPDSRAGASRIVNAAGGVVRASGHNIIYELENSGSVVVDRYLALEGPTHNAGTFTLAHGLRPYVVANAGFDNAGTLDGTGGTLAFSSPFTNSGTLTAGALRAESDVTNAGAIDIVGDARVTGRLTNAGTITVSGVGASLQLAGDASNDGTLAAERGGVVSMYSAGTARQPLVNRGKLDLTTGLLNLNGHDLVQPFADSGGRDAALAELSALLRSARNSPAGLWDGPGITDAHLDAGPHTLALGTVADAVVIRLTWNGDANLDGKVDADDYFRIDSGFLDQPASPYFAQGDFNYDGTINADDYFLIDAAFLGQGAPLGGEGGGTSALAVAVPEPAVLVPLLLTSLSLCRRRRLADRAVG